MAVLTQNALMHGASGKFGNSVVFRQAANGETVVATPPRRKAPATIRELAERDRFRRAAHMAKIIAKDPVLGPQYKAKAKPGHGAYHVALTEHLNSSKNCKSITKAPAPITREVSIEIAKFNLLAINRLLIDEQAIDFVQKILIAPNKSKTHRIPLLKRLQEISPELAKLSHLPLGEYSHNVAITTSDKIPRSNVAFKS